MHTIAVKISKFGELPSGESIEAYTLNGQGGLSLQVMTYGATVTRLLVPNARSEKADVVLGFGTLEEYLKPHPWIGATVGRVASAIIDARITVGGREYPLTRNYGDTHLHGGTIGFSRRVWSAKVLTRNDGAPSVRFSLTSLDGDQGYPGTVEVNVVFTLTAANEVVIDSDATSDQATPLTMTHHSYFNLAGEGYGTTADHEIEIFASTYAMVDDFMRLTGTRDPVIPARNDFRKPHVIGDIIPRQHRRHGDLYFVERSRPGELVEAARLYHPRSGRMLTVRTTEQCMQFFTGAILDGKHVGKSGGRYGPYAGLCLQCQGYPDANEGSAIADIMLRPSETVRQRTVYAFSSLPAR